MSHTLIPDTQAPNLELKLVGGGEWKLSDQSPSSFTMVIFYRGLHCPVCKNYLTKLNSMIDTVNELGFSVVVASMDPLERAEESKKEWGIDNLNVAYGLDEKTARSWG
ncbi:MAG: redoxin domain-containing protein, partial [Hyphomicrobiales bacterium]